MYSVYIGSMQLPVPPSEIITKVNNKNETVTLIGQGEINFPRTPGLADFRFRFRIPLHKYPWVQGPLLDPDTYLGMLEDYKAQTTPVNFIVIRTGPDGKVINFQTSTEVTVEDYEISESADEGGEPIIDINLKQWRPYSTKVATITTDGTKTTLSVSQNRSTPSAPEMQYTVKSGDTLWLIAKSQYGDGEKWKEIYQKNTDAIEAAARAAGKASSSNGNLIIPGTVLTLPARAGTA